MRGRRSRGDFEKELADLGPFIPLAREIGRAAAEQAITDTADPDSLRESLAGALSRIAAQERQQLVIKAFGSLASGDKARLLTEVFPDHTLRVALEAARIEAGKRTIANLAEIAKETGGLDLELIPFRATLGVTLCDADTYKRVGSHDITNQGHVARRLRLAHLGQSRFHLLNDTVYGESFESFRPDLADQQVIDLGCLLNEGTSDEQLEHVIYLGGTLGSNVDAYTKFTYGHPQEINLLAVAHVGVNGIHMLGN